MMCFSSVSWEAHTLLVAGFILSTNKPAIHSQAFVCNVLLPSLSQQIKYKNTFKEIISPKVEYNSVH